MYHCGDFRILSAKAVQHDYLLLLLMPVCPENGFIFQSGNAKMPENIFRIFAMDKHVSIFLKILNMPKKGELHVYCDHGHCSACNCALRIRLQQEILFEVTRKNKQQIDVTLSGNSEVLIVLNGSKVDLLVEGVSEENFEFILNLYTFVCPSSAIRDCSVYAVRLLSKSWVFKRINQMTAKKNCY